MSHRKQQLESSLQRTIGMIIAEGLSDPRISGMVSVTEVRVSPDMREASVGISVLPVEKQELSVHGLRSAAGHIQSEVRQRLRARNVPHLHFHVDPSLKKQAQILGALAEVIPPVEDVESAEPKSGDSEPQEDEKP